MVSGNYLKRLVLAHRLHMVAEAPLSQLNDLRFGPSETAVVNLTNEVKSKASLGKQTVRCLFGCLLSAHYHPELNFFK